MNTAKLKNTLRLAVRQSAIPGAFKFLTTMQAGERPEQGTDLKSVAGSD